MRFVYILPALLLIGLSACRKSENVTTDPAALLSFSADSILFDTVFTGTRSTTRRLKIYNPNAYAVRISQIRLQGKAGAAFQVNINGVPDSVGTVELAGNDSLSVFVRVTIDPGSSTTPFIVTDTLTILTNGNLKKLPLIAYGQNARFVNTAIITNNTTWDNDLPYVISHDLRVAEGATLTLEAGTRLYFRKNAKLTIGGSLAANGTSTDTITFASDRLEQVYADEPGQWGGLHFLATSRNNRISHATLKNAVTGIRIDAATDGSTVDVLLSGCIIKNMSAAGIEAYGAALTGYNNLFYNCGQYLLYAAGGGSYIFKQNTFAMYNTLRQTPALFFSDTATSNSLIAGDLQISIVNCIVWGSLAEELVIPAGTQNLFTDIQSNLLKSQNTTFNGNDNLLNTDPMFRDPRHGNYLPAATSPVIGRGISPGDDAVFLNTDIVGKSRNYPSELGCYEL